MPPWGLRNQKRKRADVFILILVLMVCMLAHVLSLRGRKNQPGMEKLRGWYYAHRGLHGDEKPENSMAAFAAAVEKGYGAELDVHLLKDGALAVIHDSDLLRTTGQPGQVEDLTAEDLKNYHLQGTGQTIPELGQVLALFAGKTPLIIELKSAGGNAAALTEAACRMLENYSGTYCLESFDPACVRWLRKNRPDILRGQLAENAMKLKGRYPWPVRFASTYCLGNFLTRPDFIAYRFEDRKTASNAICRKLWGLQGVSWTLRTPEDFQTAVNEGWLPIFEGFDPGAALQISGEGK